MTTPAPPRRRWFRFGLSTLFVLVTLAGCAAWWVQVQLKWIEDRHEVLRKCLVAQLDLEVGPDGVLLQVVPRSAPGLLWVFGEQGYESLLLQFGKGKWSRDLTDPELEAVTRAARLFPEARMVEGNANTDDEESAFEHRNLGNPTR